MIRTHYNITLEIDDEKYKIIYTNPSKQKQEEFKKEFEEYQNLFENITDKQNEIEFLQTQMNVNSDFILALEDKDKKLKALNEQRANINALKKLKDELKALGEQSIDLNSLAKRRFSICVSGEDKDKLMGALEEKNISYYELMDEVDTQLAKAKEKK